MTTAHRSRSSGETPLQNSSLTRSQPQSARQKYRFQTLPRPTLRGARMLSQIEPAFVPHSLKRLAARQSTPGATLTTVIIPSFGLSQRQQQGTSIPAPQTQD